MSRCLNHVTFSAMCGTIGCKQNVASDLKRISRKISAWPDCNRYWEALLNEYYSPGRGVNGTTGKVKLHT
ncbi:hypothetical protein DPMN_052964 [Dreissena polymorpha]|uniref:Uncharacterized protein n=1 Tax=Dreissena polymorpha TaxID=45954 RepID=A0A9D4CKI5_DREPO|nr:hypothetical protein DPMN_052964 [Dreissena polymorpha]